MPKFVWNLRKSVANERKHGVSFDEAATVFDDPLRRTMFDVTHSRIEDRFWTIGRSTLGQLLLVVTTVKPDGSIRIISARRPTRRERHDHEQG